MRFKQLNVPTNMKRKSNVKPMLVCLLIACHTQFELDYLINSIQQNHSHKRNKQLSKISFLHSEKLEPLYHINVQVLMGLTLQSIKSSTQQLCISVVLDECLTLWTSRIFSNRENIIKLCQGIPSKQKQAEPPFQIGIREILYLEIWKS